MSYVDLVMCETPTGKVELYQAPNVSMLKPDDLVVIKNDKQQDVNLKVKNVISISNKSDEYRFILELFGILTHPKKLIGKITYQKFEYRDEDGDADDQG